MEVEREILWREEQNLVPRKAREHLRVEPLSLLEWQTDDRGAAAAGRLAGRLDKDWSTDPTEMLTPTSSQWRRAKERRKKLQIDDIQVPVTTVFFLTLFR